jgi:(p)ppGpp synthase/HD superfamily hydrolase
MALTATDRFAAAMTYAYLVHGGQRRKGSGTPYIAHILGVTALAIEYGANEDESIAALLHDAAEDGGGEATLAEIRARFGDAVADIVLGCSDSLVEDPEDKLPWRTSKARATRCA